MLRAKIHVKCSALNNCSWWEKVIRFFGSIFDILYSVELTIFLLTLLVGTAFDLDKIAKILLLGLQAFCSIIAYTFHKLMACVLLNTCNGYSFIKKSGISGFSTGVICQFSVFFSIFGFFTAFCIRNYHFFSPNGWFL